MTCFKVVADRVLYACNIDYCTHVTCTDIINNYNLYNFKLYTRTRQPLKL